jgi:hypothetical protein
MERCTRNANGLAVAVAISSAIFDHTVIVNHPHRTKQTRNKTVPVLFNAPTGIPGVCLASLFKKLCTQIIRATLVHRTQRLAEKPFSASCYVHSG